jgi:cytidylate kinase
MPLITISRMYGSGGSEIAAIVARTLAWKLYDNEIIDGIAERSGLSRAEVSEKEERVPSLAERISGAFTLGTPEAMPPFPDGQPNTTEEEIVAATRRVIEDAVQRGPAVFVGRGAQCLLAERSDALHVFCYAPTPALVAYARDRRGVPAKEAERKVHDMNKQREQYVRRHWSRDWMSPSNYHLCLDTSWHGIERSAVLIVGVAQTKFGAG